MHKPPNLFVIGAPKTGTTALCAYLGDHPDVFMPEVKEPYFFAEDIVPLPVRLDATRYRALYENAGGKRWVGDGSTWYLRSAVAVPNILKEYPDARFIVMLRNPVDMVISMHAQALYDQNEVVSNFEKAWELQAPRKEGRSIPRSCGNPFVLQYAWKAKLGEQMARLVPQIPRGNLLVIMYEDFRKNTAEEYRRTLDFLGLPNDHRLHFPSHNARRVFKNSALTRLEYFIRRPPPWAADIKASIKRVLGVQSIGIHKKLDRINQTQNLQRGDQGAVSEATKSMLAAYFSDDIVLLESVIGVDLSAWRIQSVG